MHDLTVAGNQLEAALWCGLAVVAGVAAVRNRGTRRRQAMVLAAALLAFGVSDVIESRTGAWWRPPALLVFKGACLAVFAGVAIAYRRERRCESRVAATGESPDPCERRHQHPGRDGDVE